MLIFNGYLERVTKLSVNKDVAVMAHQCNPNEKKSLSVTLNIWRCVLGVGTIMWSVLVYDLRVQNDTQVGNVGFSLLSALGMK